MGHFKRECPKYLGSKTLVIINKEFKNIPDRVSRSPTPERGVIQAGNSYEKEASLKLTNGPSVVTEVKDGGSFPITKMKGSTQRSSSLEQNSESSRNGKGSHTEMGRENSTCRAKTYGNSFSLVGQRENMEGVVTLTAAGDQEPLGRGWTSPEESVSPLRGETDGDSFTGEAQGENTVGVVTLAAVGDQEPLERGWTSPEECFNPSKAECSGSEVGGELIGTCMTKIDGVRGGRIVHRCGCTH